MSEVEAIFYDNLEEEYFTKIVAVPDNFFSLNLKQQRLLLFRWCLEKGNEMFDTLLSVVCWHIKRREYA